MKKKTKTCFSDYYDNKSEKKDINNTSLSLIISGIVLLICFLLKATVSVGAAMIIYFTLAFFSLLIIIGGIIVPQKLILVHKGLLVVLNKIGILILKIFLIIPYLITCCISIFYASRQKKKLGFETWQNYQPLRETYFEKVFDAQVNNNKRFFVVSSLVTRLFHHKMAILIPLVILLLIVGLIFFFITSSSVFPFIYTLF